MNAAGGGPLGRPHSNDPVGGVRMYPAGMLRLPVYRHTPDGTRVVWSPRWVSVPVRRESVSASYTVVGGRCPGNRGKDAAFFK